MVYFHSTFYYVRYTILLKCWKQVLFVKPFNFKLFVYSIITTIIFFLHQLVNVFFRAVDELLFFRYRRVTIKKPVFIFANPRSGTTYLHHLLTNDNRYAYMKLAHTIFPSVSFFMLYRLLSLIDKKTGNLVKRILGKTAGSLFRRWENIHPLAFNKAEEDEAIYTFALASPAVFLVFPFLHLFKDTWLADNENEKVKTRLMNYYENCIRRFMYAGGRDKIYLSKNVMSSGRINCLMKRFPDARIIYIARNPYEALPSFISMFGVMYSSHSPLIKSNDAAMQAWAWLGISFYKHFHAAKGNNPETDFCGIKYDDLVLHPSLAIEKIYEKLSLDLSPGLKATLDKLETENKRYRSKHVYSLEQYGLSKEIIYSELKFIFDEYGFTQ